MPGLVYLFLGRENALKGEALEDLKRRTLSGGNADLNYAVFYPEEFDPHEFQDAVNTQPFLSPSRFVVIRDADRLPREAKDSVISYAKNRCETTVLIITADPDPRAAAADPFLAEISKYAKIRHFGNLEGEGLRRYIAEKASAYDKRINRDAAELVIAKVGNDLGKLRMAVEKLANYSGQRKAIEKKDVEVLVGRSLEETVFDMTDAMVDGKASRSLSILSGLLRDSARPESIIGAIGTALKRKARSRGSSQRVKRWFKECFSYLAKADHDIKNRDLDKKVILESLIIRLSELSELA